MFRALALMLLTGCSLSLDLSGEKQEVAFDGGVPGDVETPDSSADAQLADSLVEVDGGDAARPDVALPDSAQPDADLTCDPGWHDGGDGRCVPQGSCVPGYLLRFPDQDMDGVGAGVAACVAANAVRWADEPGDCDDNDPTAWVVDSEVRDLDDDGYTVRLPLGCGRPATQRHRPPPVSRFVASQLRFVEGEGNDGWDEAENVLIRADHSRCRPRRNDGCPVLDISGFDLRLPIGANVVGIEAHVFRRFEDEDEDQETSDFMHLSLDGVTEGDRRAQNLPWTDEWTVATYGGPDDLWGLELSVADIESPAFGVQFHVVSDARDDLYVKHIWVTIYVDLGDDCDDLDPTTWSVAEGFRDEDGDGWGGEPLSTCIADLPPEGMTFRGGDCYDRNRAARPGATFQPIQRGDGSYDYDCDGVETAQVVRSAASCTAPACSPTLMEIMPADCGQLNEVGQCVGGAEMCLLGTQEIVTSCR